MSLPFVLLGATFFIACGGATDDPSQAPLACLAPGETRVVLSGTGVPAATIVTDGTVLYSAGFAGPERQGEVWSVPLADPGLAKRVEGTKYVETLQEVAAGPRGSLVYVTAEVTPNGGGTTIRYNGILLHEADGRIVPIVEPGSSAMTSLVAGDDDGVTFGRRNGDQIELVRWSASTGERIVLASGIRSSPLSRLVTHGGEVFHVERVEGGSRVVAYPLDGSAPRVLTTFAHDKTFVRIAAVDSELVFLHHDLGKGPSTPGSMHVYSRKTGEPVRSIPDVQLSYRTATDDTHVYWIDAGNLSRWNKTSGTTEVLLQNHGLSQAVAVDSCNVYYSVGDEVFARGK
jgi:hypothetical protein